MAFVCIALATAAGAEAQAGRGVKACPGLEPGPTHTVTRIVDAETVALDDGRELRLIGALAPRAIDAGADAGMWPPEIAARAELQALLLGRSVDLAFGGERTDRHGRLQAQAFFQEGDVRHWVQGHLVEQGLARAYTLAGNRACGEELLVNERAARDAQRGLWAEATYAVKPADTLALSRYRATFQIVEGRVARVAQVRGRIYLNFGLDWRRAFAVSLRRGDRGLLGAYAGNVERIEGKIVRARGWIEHHNTNVIDLSVAGLIEILDEPNGVERRTNRPPGIAAPDEPHAPAQEMQLPSLVETG